MPRHFNHRQSRYRGSKILEYIETNPATGEVTRLPYLENRFPVRRDYNDSVMHLVVEGDEIDWLAYIYYGREELWWLIADQNKIDNPNDLRMGDILEIPPMRIASQYS